MTLSHGRKGAGDVTSSGVNELENDASVTLPTFSVIGVGGQDETGADPVLAETVRRRWEGTGVVLYLYRNGGYRLGVKQ